MPRSVDDVACIIFIIIICASRYSDNAVLMQEALTDYVNSETECVERQLDYVQWTKAPQKLITSYSYDLFLDFGTIKLVINRKNK